MLPVFKKCLPKALNFICMIQLVFFQYFIICNGFKSKAVFFHYGYTVFFPENHPKIWIASGFVVCEEKN